MRDRLGSATTLVNHDGQITSRRYFDPFGRTSTASTQFTDLSTTNRYRRGFTDHEHLNEQQLIHMNGRIYDYNVGRFMSVDPFIQAPSSTQSINPYSYIMNNPLAGTNPTGYMGKCDQNPACQMQSFFSSVGSGGSSLIGHLMGRLKTTLTNGHDTKQAKKAQDPKAAEVKSPAAVASSNINPDMHPGKDRQERATDNSTVDPTTAVAGVAVVGPMGIPLPLIKSPEQIANDKAAAISLTGALNSLKELIQDLRRPSSQSLADTLTKAGLARPGDGWDAHHIVPWGHSLADAKAVREQLSEVGIDINSADNLVWLPRTQAVKTASGVRTVAHHGDGVHSHAAIRSVGTRVSMGVGKGHTRAILNGIRNELNNGIKGWE